MESLEAASFEVYKHMSAIACCLGTPEAQSKLRKIFPYSHASEESPPVRQQSKVVVPVQLKAEEVLLCDNVLGEAPMYNSEEHALYWLDINGKKLLRFAAESGDCKSWSLPEVAGSFAFAQGGGFLMGFTSGLSWFNPDTGAVQKICDFEEGLNTRANDGKCDGAGNWVIGGYNNNHRADQLNITGLWRLNSKDMSLEEILDYRFRCSNTIAFSADRSCMYFCDTPTREIFKFKYSPTGKLSDKTLHWTMPKSDQGGPDGATVDTQGGLWEAQAGNWKVVRHNPADGHVDYEVQLPMNNPTSCAIGGNDMDTLYITTARHRLTEEERAQQPGAGQLWAVKLPDGIKGLAEPHFGAPSPLQ